MRCSLVLADSRVTRSMLNRFVFEREFGRLSLSILQDQEGEQTIDMKKCFSWDKLISLKVQ